MNPSPLMILGFSESEPQARAVADALGVPFALVDLHRFPDGESRVRVPPALPPRTVIYRSLDQPNAKLFELGLAATAARCAGASDLTLVAPYLCYMRQDTAFVPGEAVSQTLMGALLGGLVRHRDQRRSPPAPGLPSERRGAGATSDCPERRGAPG